MTRDCIDKNRDLVKQSSKENRELTTSLGEVRERLVHLRTPYPAAEAA